MSDESNKILDFSDSKNDLLKKKIQNLPEERKDVLLLVGTVQEKLALVKLEYGLSVLAKDASPEVRKEVVKHTADLRPFCNDPSATVRHAAALQLKSILNCTVPEVKLDRNGMPYVVDTPERRMLNEMVSDLSVAVSTVAKQTLDDLKKREVKEAVNLVLNKSGMDDVSCTVAKNLESLLYERFQSNDIDEIPVRSAAYSNRKVDVER